MTNKTINESYSISNYKRHKANSLFVYLFAGVTLLEMIGDTQSILWLQYGCKPLIIGLLVRQVSQQLRLVGYPVYLRWLLVGMGFALAGDIFLMIREADLFAPGLGAFLVMQICYSLAFWQSIPRLERRERLRLLGSNASLFALYAGCFMALLRPAFVRNPVLVPLWWPVVIYGICLSVMGLMATLRQRLINYNQVVIGALLFILSDSCIAIDKFLQPVIGATWIIMSTYSAAQYLIVTGMLRQAATEQA